jgi:hypothetical protein
MFGFSENRLSNSEKNTKRRKKRVLLVIGTSILKPMSICCSLFLKENESEPNIISVDLTNLKLEALKEYHALNDYIHFLFLSTCDITEYQISKQHLIDT